MTAFVSDDMAGEALLASFLCIARVYASVQFAALPTAFSLHIVVRDDAMGDNPPGVTLELHDARGVVLAGMAS